MSNEWYTLIWVMANLFTAISYYLIPLEIYQWTRSRGLRGLWIIGVMFGAFIVLCGTHHVLMAWHPPHDFLSLIVTSMTGVVSVAVWIALVSLRVEITAILAAVDGVIDEVIDNRKH